MPSPGSTTSVKGTCALKIKQWDFQGDLCERHLLFITVWIVTKWRYILQTINGKWFVCFLSECSLRYDNLVWENRRDSHHVTSPSSWVYIMPRIKNSKKKMAGCWILFRWERKFMEERLCSISSFFTTAQLKIVTQTYFYHAISCLTVPKLSYLGEHRKSAKHGHCTRAKQECCIMTD